MPSVLDHYTSRDGYHQESNQAWDGLRSSKFGRTIQFTPRKDLINSIYDLPDQTVRTGRIHFSEISSAEKSHKPCLKVVQRGPHWHLRQSKKRTMLFKPTQPHPRRQRRHLYELTYNPQECRKQSVKTFYGSLFAPTRQYSIQDKMQRKVRIDQLQLRKTFFKDFDIFKR